MQSHNSKQVTYLKQLHKPSLAQHAVPFGVLYLTKSSPNFSSGTYALFLCPAYWGNSMDYILLLHCLGISCRLRNSVVCLSNFSEARLVAVEHQLQSQNDNFVNLITKVEETANSALSLAKTNAASITETNQKGECNKFEIDQLKVKVSDLFTEVNKLRDELDDCQNRSMRKTLIFKNILINSSKLNLGMRVKLNLYKKLKKLWQTIQKKKLLQKLNMLIALKKTITKPLQP